MKKLLAVLLVTILALSAFAVNIGGYAGVAWDGSAISLSGDEYVSFSGTTSDDMTGVKAVWYWGGDLYTDAYVWAKLMNSDDLSVKLQAGAFRVYNSAYNGVMYTQWGSVGPFRTSYRSNLAIMPVIDVSGITISVPVTMESTPAYDVDVLVNGSFGDISFAACVVNALSGAMTISADAGMSVAGFDVWAGMQYASDINLGAAVTTSMAGATLSADLLVKAMDFANMTISVYADYGYDIYTFAVTASDLLSDSRSFEFDVDFDYGVLGVNASVDYDGALSYSLSAGAGF